jgi:ATP-dependent DNA ligase
MKHDGYRADLSKVLGTAFACSHVSGLTGPSAIRALCRSCKADQGRFLIDGETVVSNERGIVDFERQHSRDHDNSATLCAFDLLELDGEDLHQLSLDERKSKLAKLLRTSRNSGIALNEQTSRNRRFLGGCAARPKFGSARGPGLKTPGPSVS